MARIKYIAVAGNIGCGKSTLVEFLRRRYKLKPFFEPNADNPYLKDFYKDMKAYAFKSQIYFLAHKFRMQQELEKRSRRATVVQDRTIYEDAEVFAAYLHRRRCITKRDWQVYQALYSSILESLRPPICLFICEPMCEPYVGELNYEDAPRSKIFPRATSGDSMNSMKSGLIRTTAHGRLSLRPVVQIT